MKMWMLLIAITALALPGCQQPTKVEEGIASYYAASLHGRPTANGETYDREAFTAAHREIPFDTRVKVTNLDNGRSVWVRINDRGPYVEDRIIDLSEAAARELDFEDAGIAEVRLEIYE